MLRCRCNNSRMPVLHRVCNRLRVGLHIYRVPIWCIGVRYRKDNFLPNNPLYGLRARVGVRCVAGSLPAYLYSCRGYPTKRFWRSDWVAHLMKRSLRWPPFHRWRPRQWRGKPVAKYRRVDNRSLRQSGNRGMKISEPMFFLVLCRCIYRCRSRGHHGNFLCREPSHRR